jgi:hypothetical protein
MVTLPYYSKGKRILNNEHCQSGISRRDRTARSRKYGFGNLINLLVDIVYLQVDPAF